MEGGFNRSPESGQCTVESLASSVVDSGHHSRAKLEEAWGVYHEPMEFVQGAAEQGIRGT